MTFADGDRLGLAAADSGPATASTPLTCAGVSAGPTSPVVIDGVTEIGRPARPGSRSAGAVPSRPTTASRTRPGCRSDRRGAGRAGCPARSPDRRDLLATVRTGPLIRGAARRSRSARIRASALDHGAVLQHPIARSAGSHHEGVHLALAPEVGEHGGVRLVLRRYRWTPVMLTGRLALPLAAPVIQVRARILARCSTISRSSARSVQAGQGGFPGRPHRDAQRRELFDEFGVVRRPDGRQPGGRRPRPFSQVRMVRSSPASTAVRKPIRASPPPCTEAAACMSWDRTWP